MFAKILLHIICINICNKEKISHTTKPNTKNFKGGFRKGMYHILYIIHCDFLESDNLGIQKFI